MEKEEPPRAAIGSGLPGQTSATRPRKERKGDGTMVSLDSGSVFGDGDMPLPKRWVGALVALGVVIAGLLIWAVLALL